jgi:hypothetical protein
VYFTNCTVFTAACHQHPVIVFVLLVFVMFISCVNSLEFIVSNLNLEAFVVSLLGLVGWCINSMGKLAMPS